VPGLLLIFGGYLLANARAAGPHLATSPRQPA